MDKAVCQEGINSCSMGIDSLSFTPIKRLSLKEEKTNPAIEFKSVPDASLSSRKKRPDLTSESLVMINH